MVTKGSTVASQLLKSEVLLWYGQLNMQQIDRNHLIASVSSLIFEEWLAWSLASSLDEALQAAYISTVLNTKGK